MHYILGGIAIGSAVSILLIFNGRILGVSGIIREFLKNPFAEMSWRLLFILGLILSPALYSKFFEIQTFEILSSPLKLILSGFLIDHSNSYIVQSKDEKTIITMGTYLNH